LTIKESSIREQLEQMKKEREKVEEELRQTLRTTRGEVMK